MFVLRYFTPLSRKFNLAVLQCVQDVNMRAYNDTRYFGIKFQSDNGPSPYQASRKWKFPEEKCTLYVSNHSATRAVESMKYRMLPTG